ncbi:MAG: hypothetical protein AAF514_24610, partial [Verrucomicrobiota bacterium]
PAEADGQGFSLVRAVPGSVPGETDSWQISSNLNGNPGAIDDGGPVGEGAYEAWKQARGIDDDWADPDQDGLSQFMEFATGNDPGVPTPGSPIDLWRASDGTVRLALIRTTVDEIKTTVEASDDLRNWRNATGGQLVETERLSDQQERQVWQWPAGGETGAYRVRYGW